MSALLLLHAAVAAAALARPRLGRRAVLVCAAAPAVGAVWLATRADAVFGGTAVTESLRWVPELGLTLGLRLDPLGWVMAMLVCSVGVAVLVYAARYLPDDEGAARLAALLALFAGSMLGLVWSDQLLGLFVFWEATTVVSFLLVGFVDRSEAARAAAWQALLVTGAGGLALLFGVVTVGITTDTWSLVALTEHPPAATALLAFAAAGVLAGAATKSAQVPFHGWLLGAMAAPTPVSAYLHSATMVAAGVWLVVRLDPVFSPLDWWYPALLAFGAASAVWGGWRALAATDLKRVLAYSTISALGVMFALVGIGTPKAMFAAIAVLVSHALYKAALFMGVGVVDHRCGTRDLRELGGLATAMPAVAAAMGVAAASMLAVPATAGFVAKEAGVVAALDATDVKGAIGVATLVVAGILAVAYGWRLWSGAFLGPRPAGLDPPSTGIAWWAAVWVLAAAGIVLGLAPVLWSGAVADAAAVVQPAAGSFELEAWPGWGAPLAVSLGTLAAGVVAAVALSGRPLAVPRRGAVQFDAALAGLFRFATRVAATAQPGSLPVYVGVILVAAVVPAAAVAVVGGSAWPERAWSTPAWPQVVAVLVVLAAAGGVAALRTRLAAVVALGIVGYGVAALFWLHGAPDLALTQALVETVIVAAFVLVFRWLPARFRAPARGTGSGVARVVVAGAVGASVLVMVAATAGLDRPVEPPTGQLVADAEPVGGGRNVVNVILTDVRALDTLGEITVVAAAAIGALALSGLARRRLGAAPEEDVPSTGREEGVEQDLAPDRSVVLDALLRAMFPLIATFSVFMLVAGHNAPGGGFIAGLIAVAAIALRLLAGDWTRAADRPDWLQPQPLIGVGMLVAVGTLAAGGAAGGFGDQAVATWTLPLVGDVKATTALVFDVGVYVLVIGAGVAILDALSARATRGPSTASEPAREGRP